jgi:hypothetical protein
MGRHLSPTPSDIDRQVSASTSGRQVDRAELEDLIRSLPDTFDEATIPGLNCRPW